MGVFIWHDPDAPQNHPPKRKYRNMAAAIWTVTEEGLEAARSARRLAASDVAYWSALKPQLGRFAKDQMKSAQRMERAATIWLRHFEEVGLKSILNMPVELAEELDLIFGAMNLAEATHET